MVGLSYAATQTMGELIGNDDQNVHISFKVFNPATYIIGMMLDEETIKSEDPILKDGLFAIDSLSGKKVLGSDNGGEYQPYIKSGFSD